MNPAKQNSREAIVNTAARLFVKQGYHGTGLNQIIKESGAPKGSLYYYFPNGKEELALECISFIKKQLDRNLNETLANIAGPAESIQAFIRAMAGDIHASGYDGFLPLGFWVAAETASVSDALRKACQEAFEEWKRRLAEKIAEGGFPREKADDLAAIMISMIEGAAILTMTYQDNRPLMLVAEHIPLLFRE